MDKKLQRLETFHVQDLHGATYKVHAYEHMTRIHAFLDMETQWEPTGLIEYKLATGEHLELDDKGDLFVPGSSMPLHRVQTVAHVQ